MTPKTELAEIRAELARLAVLAEVAGDDRQELSRSLNDLARRVADLDDYNANLVAQVTDAEDRIAALEVKTTPPAPEPPALEYRDSCGILRNIRGEIIPNSDLESYEVRETRRGTAQDATTDAWWANATEGLPEGLWRDPCGVVRKRDGTYASAGDLTGGTVQ